MVQQMALLPISGLNATTDYDVTYDDGIGTNGPTTILSDASGDIVISGLEADGLFSSNSKSIGL